MRVGFIGAGTMARALARGWGEPVLCSDGGSGRARALAEELGGEAFDSNLEVARRADVVVLAHKPAQLKRVAHEIADAARVVVSVLGRTSIGNVRSEYREATVFRMIPNTPVEVRRGVMCFASPDGVDPALEAEVINLFERLGTVVRVPEPQIDVAMVAMSVAPAYDALLVEAQVDSCVRYGLNAELASRLVVETMAGTAELLTARAYDTLSVRREVTSPGGSTAKGLDALERAGVRGAFQAGADAILQSQ